MEWQAFFFLFYKKNKIINFDLLKNGNATKYSLCKTPCYKNVDYPNKKKPSKNGFCYTMGGAQNAWGECDDCNGVIFE